MKKSELRQIIKEEIKKLYEADFSFNAMFKDIHKLEDDVTVKKIIVDKLWDEFVEYKNSINQEMKDLKQDEKDVTTDMESELGELYVQSGQKETKEIVKVAGEYSDKLEKIQDDIDKLNKKEKAYQDRYNKAREEWIKLKEKLSKAQQNAMINLKTK